MTNSPIHITRRAALATLAVAGTGFAMFGPRGDAEHVGNRRILQYWEKWTGHEAVAMQQIVDEFNASQDKIFVRFFSMSSIDQKAMIAIAGGRPPDIIGLYNFNVPAYAESGAIIPLDDLAADRNIKQEHYVSALWPLLTHENKLYSVVSTCGSVAMFYNRTLFAQHGLDPDNPPQTIEQLDDANRILTQRDNAGRLSRVGYLAPHPGWWLWHWGYHFGGNLYDQTNNRALATSPQNIQAFQWLAEHARWLNPRDTDNFRAGFGPYSSPQNAFLEGRIAIVQQGPWLANVIDAFQPDMDYAVAPFPTHSSILDPSAPTGLLDADVLVVPRGAQDPEASMDFIAHVQRPENIQRLSAAHCKNAPLCNMPDSFSANHRHRFVKVPDQIANSPNAYFFPRTRVWPQYEDAMRNAFFTTWAGRLDPADALQSAQSLVQARLDDVAEKRAKRKAIQS